jgi:hypothetical protein
MLDPKAAATDVCGPPLWTPAGMLAEWPAAPSGLVAARLANGAAGSATARLANGGGRSDPTPRGLGACAVRVSSSVEQPW